MKTSKMFLLMAISLSILVSSCQSSEKDKPENLEDVAYDAFIYAYPMLEQVKTLNGMFSFLNMKPNKVSMLTKLPWENIGQPVVAPNMTSMNGGLFIDISHGPVTVELPEVKDRYIVYQCIDVFTHNFYYMGSRANHGDGGQFIFYNKSQKLPETSATPVLMEGDFATIVIRIDIKNADEFEKVKNIQNSIKVISAPEQTRRYPEYDKEKAFSPAFVEYINELLTEIPESETALYERFSKIGLMSDVKLSEEDNKQVQSGIDSAYTAILKGVENLDIGNGYIGATEIFGTREFLNGNYLARAVAADFGLWGNSKEEANYFFTYPEGEGKIVFKQDELPPLTDIGFWSITVHDENITVLKNEYNSYVLSQDKMKFEDDGSLIINISSKPEEGNWLYTPGGKMVIVFRVYQADPEKIGDYVPPAFIQSNN